MGKSKLESAIVELQRQFESFALLSYRSRYEFGGKCFLVGTAGRCIGHLWADACLRLNGGAIRKAELLVRNDSRRRAVSENVNRRATATGRLIESIILRVFGRIKANQSVVS